MLRKHVTLGEGRTEKFVPTCKPYYVCSTHFALFPLQPDFSALILPYVFKCCWRHMAWGIQGQFRMKIETQKIITLVSTTASS